MSKWYTVKVKNGYNVVEEIERFKSHEDAIPVAMEMLKEALEDADYDDNDQVNIIVTIDRYEE